MQVLEVIGVHNGAELCVDRETSLSSRSNGMQASIISFCFLDYEKAFNSGKPCGGLWAHTVFYPNWLEWFKQCTKEANVH